MIKQSAWALKPEAPELLSKAAGGRALRIGFEETSRNVPRLADYPKAFDWAVAGLSVQGTASPRDAKRNCLTPLIA